MLTLTLDSLTATLSLDTGAVVVSDAGGVVALGTFDIDNGWLGDELGELSHDGSDESVFVQIQAGFVAQIEDRDAETWTGPDDYDDDGYALASAGFGTDEDYAA